MLRLSVFLTILASLAHAQRIDLPRGLPTPFGIELGEVFHGGENETITQDHRAFKVYLIEPPNPIQTITAYKLWVSKRYGITTMIEADTLKSENGTGPFFEIKEILAKAYGEPRNPTPEEFAIYDYGLDFLSLKRYDFKYYWQKKGWHILMFTRNGYTGKLFFTVDRALERSFKYAPN